MRLTIVKADDTVGVDGEFYRVDCSSLPADFHALQWADGKGEIEHAGLEKPAPRAVTDLNEFQAVIEAWQAAKAARVAEEIAREESVKAAEEAARVEREEAETRIPPVPASITRRQAALELLARELIPPTEAVAMVATATPPAMVAALIEALPEDKQPRALIDFAATTYERSNPLLVDLASAASAQIGDLDGFFRDAAAR